jgi:hypothetical protein
MYGASETYVFSTTLVAKVAIRRAIAIKSVFKVSFSENALLNVEEIDGR